MMRIVSTFFHVKPANRLLGLLAGFFFTSFSLHAQPEQSPLIKPVKLVMVPMLQDNNSHSFVARIEAGERAELSFQVPGQLSELPQAMGARVKRGQLLAAIDPHDYELALAARQAEYDLALVKYQRAKQLFEKQLVSEDQLDQLKTAMTAAKVGLDNSQTQLSYTRLNAPFDGSLAFTHVKKHEFVGAKQAVLSLISRDTFEVIFDLPAVKRSEISPESLKTASLWAHVAHFPHLEIPLTFEEISTQPNRDTNSYQVTLSAVRPERLNILPGMSAMVIVRGGEYASAWRVPQNALFAKEGNRAKVWRFDPLSQRLSQVDIELDAQGHLVGGLQGGEHIVEAGIGDLHSGQQVRPWTREGGI